MVADSGCVRCNICHSVSNIVNEGYFAVEDLLEALVGQPWAYLGMIGSRAKVAKFHIRLKMAGIDPDHLARVHAPIGLDIGAETPAEIAVSVMAELVRVRRGHERPVTAMRQRTLND